jgi:phage tail-like protein
VPNTARNDPYRAFNFRVEIDGITAADFSEVSGIGVEINVIEYRSLDEMSSSRKIPGRTRHLPIVLRRGLTANRELWSWIRSAIDGNVQRRNASVVLLDEDGTEVFRVNVVQAWPSAWRLSGFDAASSEVVIEELVVEHEGLDVV